MLTIQLQIPKEPLAEFCRRWQVSELAIFGSALGENFGPESDIDVLVTFAADADWSLFDHVRMEQELKSMFKRDVDLVSRRAIERSQNWIRRKTILETAQVIYAAQ